MKPKINDYYNASKATPAPAISRTAAPIAPAHAAIAATARTIWEESGRPEGRDTAIWLEAERRLRGGFDFGRPGDDARADTRALLGEPDDTLDGRLEGFGEQAAERSVTSL
jgi:Protein of unknown function (DUF2934)